MKELNVHSVIKKCRSAHSEIGNALIRVTSTDFSLIFYELNDLSKEILKNLKDEDDKRSTRIISNKKLLDTKGNIKTQFKKIVTNTIPDKSEQDLIIRAFDSDILEIEEEFKTPS